MSPTNADIWPRIEGSSDLGAVHEHLEALREVLLRERGAVAQLDVDALHGITAEKQELVLLLEELAGPATPSATPSATLSATPSATSPALHAAAGSKGGVGLVNADSEQRRTLRDAVRALAVSVRAQARANGALLADAVAIVGGTLGLRANSSTYDNRARLRPGVRLLGSKSV